MNPFVGQHLRPRLRFAWLDSIASRLDVVAAPKGARIVPGEHTRTRTHARTHARTHRDRSQHCVHWTDVCNRCASLMVASWLLCVPHMRHMVGHWWGAWFPPVGIIRRRVALARRIAGADGPLDVAKATERRACVPRRMATSMHTRNHAERAACPRGEQCACVDAVVCMRALMHV